MLRELCSQSPLLAMPLGVLFLFFSVFAGAVVRAYGARRTTFEAIAMLPLAHDEHQAPDPNPPSSSSRSTR